ncbi:uncharacterized protein UHO2_00454 [Ustilago hordei]|uniref:uncharacterized protein n=1 Tax=Ustilago hordei TaxID=120017 RepID=UPI001A3B972B|nr:uncharacterized protein UHO2_00454 [Ustilago hordei]SYW81969.1 uncharacterized protein UHO2_00454 [Ustilago hordei]
MMDESLHNKLERLLSLMEAQSSVNYEKYASPTRPKYFKPRVDLYNQPRMDPYGLEQEDDASATGGPDLLQSKPIATPFPKFNPRDVEIFILEAKAWFKFNQVYEQACMINHMSAQLEGNACEWWASKLHINQAQEGRLFHGWHYFTECLAEQFNPHNARMEAYNKLLALRLTSDAPGAATHHVKHFRDLEGQVNLVDNELVMDLFQGSLTCSLQEKFERNPPVKRWEWYQEVKENDWQRMLLQQSPAYASSEFTPSSPAGTGHYRKPWLANQSAFAPSAGSEPKPEGPSNGPYQCLPPV